MKVSIFSHAKSQGIGTEQLYNHKKINNQSEKLKRKASISNRAKRLDSGRKSYNLMSSDLPSSRVMGTSGQEERQVK